MTEPKTHRAVYRALGKPVWSMYQKRSLEFWKNERSLKLRRVFAKRYYLPLIKPLVKSMDEDISILEVGSGPVCAAQYLNKGEVTYIDPFMDVYRKLFPGVMPEQAYYLAAMVEDYKWGKQKFDLVLCFSALSDLQNPELALNQIKFILKKKGVLALSVEVWPTWVARAHVVLTRHFPWLPQFGRLYCYTEIGIENTLLRHFSIASKQTLKSVFSWISLKQEVFFICEDKKK